MLVILNLSIRHHNKSYDYDDNNFFKNFFYVRLDVFYHVGSQSELSILG